MATIEELLATPVKFHHWLEMQHHATPVGLTRSVCDCPLARYLSENGVPDPVVGSRRVDWGDSFRSPFEGHAKLPEWAQEFVQRVDEGAERGATLYAGGCLAELREIEDAETGHLQGELH